MSGIVDPSVTARLAAALHGAQRALDDANAAVGPIPGEPVEARSSYLEARATVQVAIRDLYPAVRWALQCARTKEYAHVQRALHYTVKARQSAIRAKNAALASRIADDPENWLRDRSYIDPRRLALLEYAERLLHVCKDLNSPLRHMAFRLMAVQASNRGTLPVTWPARWLAASSVRVLPPAHRPRYAEEFASELTDYATLPRRRQMALARRQATTVLRLRRVLGREVRPISVRER
jgi:hypothetical protein